MSSHKNISQIRIQSITMARTLRQIHHKKSNRTRENGDKDGKVLYELMNNAVYGKIVKN